ncbi:hypothetical protein V2A60_006455 [Cordyceps javanica]|uniref:Cell wall serine-threonine-rich galactomannoprotein Mp1 n=1 Tax=Cordyceps javanica TaxID=43265 RepID=A0A545V7Y7_9HYPO|nr:cell wall serine-threonine-rich galactomannoprotein Mp1 [Cordyceps javanica]TQW09002.1 cell wall serine-threonine-rich galactomannoprotein Mp1 [Cordyceps javanica]
MKYAAILSLGLAATAAASASIVERDAAPYKKVVESITTAVDNLDSAVQKYSGDKQPVIDASDALVKALDDGKTTIDGLGSLSAGDAGPLAGDLGTLSAKSQTLTDDLKGKRGDVERAGECDSVRKALGDINTSAQALVDTAVGKIPKGLQSLAQGFVSQFTDGFKETQDYFSTSNCQNGGGGGNATSSSTSSGGSKTSGSTSSPTNSQAAATPSGSGAASLLAPVWPLGAALALLAVYF